MKISIQQQVREKKHENPSHFHEKWNLENVENYRTCVGAEITLPLRNKHLDSMSFACMQKNIAA